MNTQESRDAFEKAYPFLNGEEDAQFRGVWNKAWDASRAALKGPVDVESLARELLKSIFQGIPPEPQPKEIELLTNLLSSYSVQRDVEEGRLREALRQIKSTIPGWVANQGGTASLQRQRLVKVLEVARAALLPTELREDKSDV